MDRRVEHPFAQNRRQFFGRTATGIGTAALAALLQQDSSAAAVPSINGGGPASQDLGVMGSTH
ncbi:MAG: hypothetical protein QF363_20755, partial [Planctomycetaceae bacterium]|nr:hypothetical protein [Planctomycetaceae bacterium]